MKILDLQKVSIEDAVKEAVEVLSRGGVVVYPTETMYGIGVDPTNQEAVNNILAYKSRREGKPLSIACADEVMAAEYVDLNDSAQNIYTTLLPGPVTVVSKGKHTVAQGVESEFGTLGIRIPDYDLVRAIVREFGKPMTSTSANASYKKRPYSVQDILDNTSKTQQDLIDLVLDAGQLPKREPSTVVDTTQDDMVTLRQGALKLNEHEPVITQNVDETIAFAQKLIKQYVQYIGFKSVIVALTGDMGSGKTHFTKGIAQALGITDTIDSPTFVFEQDYTFSHGPHTHELIHIDTWRMFEEREFLDLGFVDMIDRGAVIVVEWADRVQNVLAEYSDEAKIIWVSLEYGSSIDERIITVRD